MKLPDRGPSRRRRAAKARHFPLALTAALAVSACAPITRLDYRADQPPTVSLPVLRAGIRDERIAFARLFEQELRVAGVQQEPRVEPWLHGVVSGSRSDGAPAAVQARFAARAVDTVVLIVPGLFGDCVAAQAVPFGDGVVRSWPLDPTAPYRGYADLGLRAVRLLPVPGRAASAANARLLAEAIRAEASLPGVKHIVLIGYSKGAPDLLEALELMHRDGGVPPSVAAMVAVAGAVMGTPLADIHEATYDALSPLVTPFDCTPSRGGEMASLTRRERIAWLAAHAPVPGVDTYSIIAHAPMEELAPPLRWTARLLARVDPRNDGQLLAADMVLPGSTLLAEARADHWDVALPRDRHPSALVRALTSERGYPREALFRAIVRWVVGTLPQRPTAD